MICLLQFVHKQINSNDTLPRHFSIFLLQQHQTRIFVLHISSSQRYIDDELLKITIFIGRKSVVGPERIIKGKITMFILILSVNKAGRSPKHINTQFTLHIFLPLVKWSDPNSNLDAHVCFYWTYKNYKIILIFTLSSI